MKLIIQKLNSIDDRQAKKMYDWEIDPENPFYSGPCKGPNEPPQYKNWEELQVRMNSSKTNRFGIFDGSEFIGHFSFAIDHPMLLKREPKTAWIGIGIGDQRARRRGAGSEAMRTIEREVRALEGRRIELGVFAFNEPAIRFYEKLGFKRFAEIPDFTWWADRWWADYRYEKFLS